MDSRRLPDNLARRADELRRLAQDAHRDGRSRRSAELNRAAVAFEDRYADARARLAKLREQGS